MAYAGLVLGASMVLTGLVAGLYWNIVRAVLATAALGALGRALVLHGRGR